MLSGVILVGRIREKLAATSDAVTPAVTDPTDEVQDSVHTAHNRLEKNGRSTILFRGRWGIGELLESEPVIGAYRERIRYQPPGKRDTADGNTIRYLPRTHPSENVTTNH